MGTRLFWAFHGQHGDGHMTSCDPTVFTCLEFWFSILVLTSGWRVKSGAKYSKYSSGGVGGVCVWRESGKWERGRRRSA